MKFQPHPYILGPDGNIRMLMHNPRCICCISKRELRWSGQSPDTLPAFTMQSCLIKTEAKTYASELCKLYPQTTQEHAHTLVQEVTVGGDSKNKNSVIHVICPSFLYVVFCVSYLPASTAALVKRNGLKLLPWVCPCTFHQLGDLELGGST